jgi:hypothetical protein
MLHNISMSIMGTEALTTVVITMDRFQDKDKAQD